MRAAVRVEQASVQYVLDLDGPRLKDQRGKILDLMLKTDRWLTLEEIHRATGYGAASISAQLRHLRNRTGGYTGPAYAVAKQRRGEPGRGIWEYRLTRLQDALPWSQS